jgi:hypothetical protein
MFLKDKSVIEEKSRAREREREGGVSIQFVTNAVPK